MTTSERVLFTIVAVLTISGCTVGLLSIASCGNDKPILAPNPTGANCVGDRTKAQIDCVMQHSVDSEIRACQEDVKRRVDCTKDAGHE